jgi:hypothetical protein
MDVERCRWVNCDGRSRPLLERTGVFARYVVVLLGRWEIGAAEVGISEDQQVFHVSTVYAQYRFLGVEESNCFVLE